MINMEWKVSKKVEEICLKVMVIFLTYSMVAEEKENQAKEKLKECSKK